MASTMWFASVPEFKEINVLELLQQDKKPDLGWSELKAGLDAFLREIDNYTTREKDAILRSTDEHSASVRDYALRKEDCERQILQEQQRERDMLQTIEAERHVTGDLLASVQRLQASLARLKEQGSSLQSDISSVNKEIHVGRAEKERQVRTLQDQRSKDDTELNALESALGLRITGVGENRLLFVYTLIDPAKPKREFSFVLDVSQQYKVPQCDPPLSGLAELVQQLNADRDLQAFIKRVRKAFVATLAENASAPRGPRPSTAA